jgi:hypothetical protein
MIESSATAAGAPLPREAAKRLADTATIRW